MQLRLPCLARLAALAALLLPPGQTLAEAQLAPDGSLEIDGTRIRCESVRTRLDRRLPNLGAAEIGNRLLMLNPVLLGRERPTVQRFVFAHECGHHRVGASELGADCWAVEKGVAEGWLDRTGLGDICRSFRGAPETATHPSARRRCAHLERCFADAENRRPQTVPSAAAITAASRPRLVETPILIHTGTAR